VKIFWKCFLEITPLWVKTCGEFEFDIFEAKKRFPDSGKVYCYWSEESKKCDFCLKTTPFVVKMCGETKSVVFRPKYVIYSNFRVDIQLLLNPRNFISVKFGFPHMFRLFLVAKIAFLWLFASIHRPSLNQGSVFSLRKCQIRIPRMSLPLEGSFTEKISKKFSRRRPLYFIIAPEICLLQRKQCSTTDF
jgi:hypothetical protein